MNTTDERRAMIRFMAAMLIWGSIGIFRRSIPMPSAFLAFARGILGGLSLLAYVRLRGRHVFRQLPRRMLLRFGATGALIGFNWMMLFEAYNHTTVSVATLCYYMQPTIVMLLSPLVFGERMTGKKACCALLSVLGMVLVSGVIGERESGAGNLTGILMGLGAASLYACVVMLNKRAPEADATQRTVIQLLFAGLVMIPYLAATGGWTGITLTPGPLLLLLVVCVLHTGVAYALYFGSMTGLKVQTVAVLSYLDPVSAILFSAAFLREPLSPVNCLGAALIIGAALVSEIQWKDPGRRLGQRNRREAVRDREP